MLFELIDKKKRPFVFVYTKADKLNDKQYEKCCEEAREMNSKFLMCSPIVHFTSAR